MPTTEVFIYDAIGNLIGIRIVQERNYRYDNVAKPIKPPSEADRIIQSVSQPAPIVAHKQGE